MALALLVSFQNNVLLNTVLAVLFLLLVSYYLPVKKLLLLSVFLTLAAAGVFFTGLIFYRDNQHGTTNISSLQYAIGLASRIYCFGFTGSLFAATTSMTAFIYSLQQQLHLPAIFAYGLMAAFHMAPMIPHEYRNTINSLRSRGITNNYFSIKIVTPLLVKTIRWSELLATAMTSRGFSSDETRTYSQHYVINWPDWLFCAGLLGLGLLLTIFHGDNLFK